MPNLSKNFLYQCANCAGKLQIKGPPLLTDSLRGQINRVRFKLAVWKQEYRKANSPRQE